MNQKNKIVLTSFLICFSLLLVSFSAMAAIQLGTETITFTQPISIGTPTLSAHATTKAYVDSMFSGSGPWTFSGTNVYVTNTAHNVGIGTTTPGYKLDIRGDVSINNNVTGTAISTIFTAGNTGKSYLHFPAISGSNDPGFIMHETSALTADANKGVIHISPTDDNDNVNDYVSIHGTNDPETIKLYTGGNIYTTGSLLVAGTGNSYLSGNVGIGTTSPAYKLDVSGTGRFTGALTGTTGAFSGTVSVATPTASNHATTKGYVDGLVTGASSKWTTSGTNTYLTTTTNNVGIGTTSPSEKFHVEGKISYKALKPIQYSTDSNIYFYKLGNLSGLGSRVFLEIIGQNTYGSPQSDVTYSAVSIGNADNEFAAWQYTIGDGGTGKPLVIFKDPGGTNNIDVYVKLGSYFKGSVNIIDAYGFTLNSASQTPVADPVGVTATDGYFINSNVGIGTITPGYKLDVSGTGRFTGALTGTSAAFSGTVSVATPTASNHATTKGYVDGLVTGASSKWTVSGTNTYLTATGNKVGIGTTSPAYKLTVNGTIGTPDMNNPYLVLDSANSGGNAAEQSAQISLGEAGRGSASLHLAYTGDGYSYIGMGALSGNIPTYYAMKLYYTNNNVYFPGSIGIGQASPGYKLDVSGTGRFTGTVIAAAPTASNHLTTKAYVDAKVPVVTLRDVASGTTGNAVCTANSSVCLDVVVAAAPYPSLSYSCLWTNTGSTLKARCLK